MDDCANFSSRRLKNDKNRRVLDQRKKLRYAISTQISITSKTCQHERIMGAIYAKMNGIFALYVNFIYFQRKGEHHNIMQIYIDMRICRIATQLFI